MSLQETELEKDFDQSLLNIPGYNLEVETNNVKSRVVMYIKNSIKYERCYALEGVNNHLVIIDVNSGVINKKRLINIYRSFNPYGITAKEGFSRQLDRIKLAFNGDSILLGDLNFDLNRKFDLNYGRGDLFDLFDEKLGDLFLVQLVNFNTWTRMVGLQLRSSMLDHIYVKDINLVKNIMHVKPC